MSQQVVSDKREKTLAELVIIVLIIATLMSSFIYYFFKQEQQLTQVGFDAIASTFSTKVTTVHAQWFMDGQPDVVIVYSLAKQKQSIPVNKNGWLDTLNSKTACSSIWQNVIEAPMSFMKSPVAAIEIKREKNQNGHICQYVLPTGEYFEYSSTNGKVSRVMRRN